jgi:hypothetical protein
VRVGHFGEMESCSPKSLGARKDRHGDFRGARFVEDFDLVAVGVEEGFDDSAMELSDFNVWSGHIIFKLKWKKLGLACFGLVFLRRGRGWERE